MKLCAKLCGFCLLPALVLGQIAGQAPQTGETSGQPESQKPAAAEQPSKSPSASSEHANATDDLASALIQAGSDEERNTLLLRDKDLVTKNLVSALTRQGARLSAKGDYPKAISVFTLAQSLASQLGDAEGSGHAYLDLGVAYRRQSDYPRALECFQKVAEIARASGSQRLLAQSLTDRGIVLFHLGEYAAALDSYKESLKLAETAHEDQSVEHAQVNIANVLRVEGNYAQAEQYNLKALAFEEKKGNDPRELARILNNLGNLHLVQSDYSRALHFYRQALALVEKAGDPEVLATVLNNVGTTLAAQGNYAEALDDHRRSLELAKKSGDKRAMCASLAAISDVEQLQGNYATALEDAEKSLALAEELGEKKIMAETLNTLGQIHVDRRDYNTALAAHQKSLSLAENLGYEEIMAQASSNISSDYYRLGQFDKAIEFAERATTLAEKLGDRMVLSEARSDAGRAYRATGQPDQARRAFEQSIDSVESLRSDLAGSEETRPEFFGDKIAPYQEMAQMLIAQHQGSEALVIAERAKGRTLLDILQGGKIQITRSMTESELEQEGQLESRLISLNSQLRLQLLEARPKPELLESLRSRLDQARRDYGQFQTLLYAAHPELKVKRGQPNPVTPSEATTLSLEHHSALLEFLVCETRTYLFVVTASHGQPDLEVYAIDIGSEELITKSQQFREKLARRDLTFRPLARQLYRLLVKPARKQLAGENALIVVPDGPLWNLPFQALVAENNRYLLQDYALSYVPSLTVLREMVNKRRENDKKQAPSPNAGLLAMADPVMGKESLDRAALEYRDEKLGPLPETVGEVKALRRIYGALGSMIYVGPEAREDRFKAEAARFRVLHLATHGILDEASPMYSNVLLAPSESGDDDGLLEAREIMQMDLHADLAVLSACETARGRISAGEGVIGLAWAFFVAGTSTTVVSQWKVESRSTAELMLAFHQARQADRQDDSAFRTARALQRAELKLLHDPRFSDPVYWAGFIVVGDPQ